MSEPDHASTTRAAYNSTADVYAQLIGTEISADIEAPLDRALLASFAEMVSTSSGPVADLGCGPGRVAALLAASGADVIGIDLSRAMVDLARQAHPGIPFVEGSLTDLPVRDGSLGGAVCWYSIIHTPPELLVVVGAELRRALSPDANLLVAFQAGNGEQIHRSDVVGRAVSLTNYRHEPDGVARCLTAAGFDVRARTIREPEASHESTPQAFILARPIAPNQ